MPVQAGKKLTAAVPKSKRTQTISVPQEHIDPISHILPHEKVIPPVKMATTSFNIQEILSGHKSTGASEIEKEVARFKVALSEVFSDDNINLKSVLRDDQVPLLIRAMAFAAKYETILNDKGEIRFGLMRDVVVKSFLQLSVSAFKGEGTGRKNLESVLKAFLVNRPESALSDQQKKLEKLLG